jgi:hypothetical protein
MANIAFSGGTNAVAGYGDRWQIGFFGTWLANEWWGMEMVNITQGNATVGRGDEAGTYTYFNGIYSYYTSAASLLTSAYSFKNRLFIANNDRFNFSALQNALGWEQQDVGAGFIPFNTNNSGPSDVCLSFGSLQGRLAVLGRNNVQLWTTDADPDNFLLNQPLANIGTLAPLSVQSLGDYDVLFLADSGVRSLRSLQTTLNAFVNDIGSPIDEAIVASLLTTGSQNALSIIEPNTRQYWLYLNGTIYVLAMFPNSQVTAWSTFMPTYFVSGALTTFVPAKFVVKDNQVYVLTTDGKIFRYGGSNNNTYDTSAVTVETHWMAVGQMVQATGADFSMQGAWALGASMDYKKATTTYSHIGTQSVATYSWQSFSYSAVGTHVKFQMTTNSSSQAKLGAVQLNFNPAYNKP